MLRQVELDGEKSEQLRRFASAALQIERDKLHQKKRETKEAKTESLVKNSLSIKQSCLIIRKVRTTLLIALGRHSHHGLEEKNTRYIYPHDLSGRLTKLENIVGSVNTKIVSLLDLIDDYTGDYELNPLCSLLGRLNNLLCPVKGFPPLKKSLQDAIKLASEDLFSAIEMRAFFSEKHPKDFVAAIIVASNNLDTETLLRFIKPHDKIINAIIHDKKVMVTLSSQVRTILYLCASAAPLGVRTSLVIHTPQFFTHVKMPHASVSGPVIPRKFASRL